MKKTKNEDPKKYPGYPHYSKEEDIYRNADETDADPEHINRDIKSTLEIRKKDPLKKEEIESPVPDDLIEDEEEITRSENEITPDDLKVLGDEEGDNDGGEDELLKSERIYPIDMSGDDLDIPEDDDAENDRGEEDEENQFFSLPDN